MNSRGLSGVLMIGAAATLAWAWLTGRLDKQIAQVVGKAQSLASTPGSRGESGFGRGSAGAGAGGGSGGSW